MPVSRRTRHDVTVICSTAGFATSSAERVRYELDAATKRLGARVRDRNFATLFRHARKKRAVTTRPFILFVFSSFFSSASECPLRNYVAPNEIVLGTEPAAARCGRATDTVDHHGLNMRETGLTFSFLLACFFPSPLFFLRNRRVLHHRGRGSNHTSSLLAFASLAGSWTIVLYACPKRDSSRTILATFLQLSQTLRNWGFVE